MINPWLNIINPWLNIIVLWIFALICTGIYNAFRFLDYGTRRGYGAAA
jgi:hypothetical protein